MSGFEGLGWPPPIRFSGRSHGSEAESFAEAMAWPRNARSTSFPSGASFVTPEIGEPDSGRGWARPIEPLAGVGFGMGC